MPNDPFDENQKQYYALYFCKGSPTKYHWSCYQKIFYLLRFSLLRLSTVKLSFEVAFVVVISGSSISSSLLSDVVCCANSGKYRWKSFQHLQSFVCLLSANSSWPYYNGINETHLGTFFRVPFGLFLLIFIETHLLLHAYHVLFSVDLIKSCH